VGAIRVISPEFWLVPGERKKVAEKGRVGKEEGKETGEERREGKKEGRG